MHTQLQKVGSRQVRRLAGFGLLFVCVLMLPAAARSAPPRAVTTDFTTFSLEELMSYEITSVAKKPQSVMDSASAVFVITQEDIRRSGFTTLPDLLRMAPGVQVAKTDPGDYAVSARGFLGEFANKLLVLIDGRTIYSPLFSGVQWDYNDMLLEDIERIEVIRGPGATMWGSNAVNGVINIITKHAGDTQGAMLAAVMGTQDEYYEAARYGGRIGNRLQYRAYVKHIQFGTVENELRREPEYLRAGLRADWQPTGRDDVLLTADYYYATEKSWTPRPMLTPDTPKVVKVKGDGHPGGRHVLTRWTHHAEDGAELRLQLYYDQRNLRARRSSYDRGARQSSDLGKSKSRATTYDAELQYRFVPFERHEILCGGGFRLTRFDKGSKNVFFGLDPQDRSTNIYNAFAQDEITLVRDRLKLIIGSKFEYNSYTDAEVQPSVRLLWTPHRQHTLWAAVSRAVRTPARYEHDGIIRTAVIPRRVTRSFKKGLVVWYGDEGFDEEKLTAYELGYRLGLEQFSFDATAFYNDYRDLRTIEPRGIVRRARYIEFANSNDNNMRGDTYGLELAANWQAAEWWRVQATFTWLQMQLEAYDHSRARNPDKDENMTPGTQWTLRSMMELTDTIDLDTSLYFMDEIPGLGVKRFINLTVRLGWRPIPGLELSLIGQNLLDDEHNEFSDEIYRPADSEVQRTLYARVVWKF